MRLAAVLAFALLVLAGCAARPDPPEEPPRPATIDPGQAWVLLSDGCGFCFGDPDAAEFRLVAVQRDGTVVRVDYAAGEATRTRTGIEPYQAFLDGLPAEPPLYAARDRPVHALGGLAARLGADDWAEARDALEDALRRHGGQVSTEYEATDCGAAVVAAFGEPHAGSAEHGCGVVAGEGWREAIEQMRLLGGWLTEAAPATVTGAGGSQVPSLGAEPAGSTQSPVVAAMVAQACGGIAHGCSGRSGVLVHADGRVAGFWGTPWAPMEEGTQACQPMASHLAELAQAHGDAWRMACDGGNLQPRLAQVPVEAWPTVEAHLRGVTAASTTGDPACCDRIHTTIHLYKDGAVSRIVVEGMDLHAGSPAADGAPLLGQMLDLLEWLRPSLENAWPPKDP